MTKPYDTPEDYDRVPDDDDFPEADSFRMTGKSFLDMLPYLTAGDADDFVPEPDGSAH